MRLSTLTQSLRSLMVSFALLSMSVLLVGCGGPSDRDPTPPSEMQAAFQKVRLAVSAVGQPLEVDGCRVQTWHVSTNTSAGTLGHIPSYTLATATCPTAAVTTAEATCGKGCVNNTVMVKMGTAASAPTVTVEDARQLRLHQERVAQIAELRAKLDKLEADLARE